MTDTEIVNWMQKNASGIFESSEGKIVVTWVDINGHTQTTKGDNLRVCIRNAAALLAQLNNEVV